jgi:hypothetical protein
VRCGRPDRATWIGGKDGQHATPCGGESPRDDEPVAAVVAGAAQDGNKRRRGQRPAGSARALGEARQLGERDLGHRRAGRLHERVLGHPEVLSGRVDASHLVATNEHGHGARRPAGRIGHRLVRGS